MIPVASLPPADLWSPVVLESLGTWVPVDAEDLDADGAPEIVALRDGFATLRRYSDLSAIGSGVDVDELAVGADASRFAFGDLDADGDPDLVVAGDDLEIVWRPGDGQGGYETARIVDGGTDAGAGLLLVDSDRDGDLDLVCAPEVATDLRVIENLGEGRFGAATEVHSGAVRTVAEGDLDADGDDDLVVVTAAGAVGVYLNGGGGVFAVPVRLGLGDPIFPRAAATGDLDGDSDLDVIAAFAGDPAEVGWYENRGSGTFGARASLPAVLGKALTVEAADLDGDGVAEAVVGTTDGVSVLWSSAAFAPTRITSDDTRSVAVADLDADGVRDLVVGGQRGLAWLRRATPVSEDSDTGASPLPPAAERRRPPAATCGGCDHAPAGPWLALAGLLRGRMRRRRTT